LSISNYLTLLRIFLVPLLVAVLLTGRSDHDFLTYNARILAVAIFAVAAFTDVLDGYLARLRNEVTRLGKLLDPIADKLLISAAFVSLVQLRLAPAWIVVIILGREFAVSGLRLIAATEGFEIEVSGFGKYKMIAQVFAVGFLILSSETYMLGLGFLYLVMILAIVSMVGYIGKFWRGMQPELRKELRRRRTFREMKEQMLGTARAFRRRRKERRIRRILRRETDEEVRAEERLVARFRKKREKTKSQAGRVRKADV
jgi:CDP-diacylglycerol--glycerol-3-phosphate 3-phosphatidyltransferase